MNVLELRITEKTAHEKVGRRNNEKEKKREEAI
jgi:hypothetical protein